jgi:hypothetical protein
LTRAGLGQIEIRARSPYRYLHRNDYPELSSPVMLESIVVAAYKVPAGPDGPAIFAGRRATYIGPETTFNDGRGHILERGIPVSVSDAAASQLSANSQIILTGPTWHVRGGGCC